MARTRAFDPTRAMLQRLKEEYPEPRCELDFETPLQLLVATILSAQCTDARVNEVTKGLFPSYPDAPAFAEADPAALEEAIRPTGFYRNKAKAIRGACRMLLDEFGGEVPRTMAELLRLPGVARKTANVVLGVAFGLSEGIVVDTHVARVARRMDLTRREPADAIEEDLMKVVPRDDWRWFGAAVVLHGRYVCKARNPECLACPIAGLCPRYDVP